MDTMARVLDPLADGVDYTKTKPIAGPEIEPSTQPAGYHLPGIEISIPQEVDGFSQNATDQQVILPYHDDFQQLEIYQLEHDHAAYANPSSPSQTSHTIITRSMKGVIKPNPRYALLDTSTPLNLNHPNQPLNILVG